MAKKKYTRFTLKEEQLIVDNYKLLNVIEISSLLKRQPSIVRAKMKRMKLDAILFVNQYSKEESEFIENNYQRYNNSELSEIMGIKRRRVELILRSLGKKRKLNTNLEDQENVYCYLCENLYPKTTDYFYFSKDGKLKSTKCISCAKEDVKISGSILKNYISTLVRGIKSDSKRNNKNNIHVDIDSLFIQELYNKQKGQCAITGISLEFTKLKGRNLKNLSIDRIDSSRGYTKDNIQLVCLWANLAKTDLSLEDFSLFIETTYKNLNKEVYV